MKLKKSIAALGLGATLMGIGTSAFAQTDYNGISVDAVEAQYAPRYVEGATQVVAIKNNNTWPTTITIHEEHKEKDGTWVDTGWEPQAVHLAGGEKTYLDTSENAPIGGGHWKYVYHAVTDSGNDLGTFADGFGATTYRAMVYRPILNSKYYSGSWVYWAPGDDVIVPKGGYIGGAENYFREY